MFSLSCNSDVHKETELTDEFILTIKEIDGNVQLNWTPPNFESFREYHVYRATDKDSYPIMAHIHTISDVNETHFLDEEPFAISDNYYWIEAIDSTNINGLISKKSNVEFIDIGDYESFPNFPESVIFNAENDLLGFTDHTHTFTLYNYKEKRIIGTKQLGNTFKYPAFAKSEERTVIYLSESDENILTVYETSSLNEISKMTIQQKNPRCVTVNSDRKLYVFGNKRSKNIEVVSRNNSESYLISTSSYEKINTYYCQYMHYCSELNTLYCYGNDMYDHFYIDLYHPDYLGDIHESNCCNYYLYELYYPCIKVDPYSGDIHLLPKDILKLEYSKSISAAYYGPSQDVAFTSTSIYTAPLDEHAVKKYSRTGELTEIIDVPGYPINIFVDDEQLIVLFVEDRFVYLSDFFLDHKGHYFDTDFGITTIDL